MGKESKRGEQTMFYDYDVSRGRIAPLLGTGRACEKSMTAIMSEAGIDTTRQFFKVLNYERGTLGIPICTSGHGYYLPSTAAEAAECLRFTEAKPKNVLWSLWPVRRFARSCEGQERMDLDEV